jgi:polysaccharide export outer membrane protein
MPRPQILRIFFFTALTVSLSACSINRNVMFSTPRGFVFDELPASLATEYRIAQNDVLSFQLFSNNGQRLLAQTAGSTESQGRGTALLRNQVKSLFMVEANGDVDLPEIGTVYIAGMTIHEARESLESKYSEYYNDPYAQIEVTNKRVLIFTGEPGQAAVIPLTNPNMTLIEVIAQAGGIRQRGDARNVKLIRRGEKGQEVYQFDLSTIDGLAVASTTVQAGDVVYIEPMPEYALEILQDLTPLLGLISGVGIIISLLGTN